jgi:hypothetical protein
VKDEYKNGIRRTLNLTVESSATWLRLADKPTLEIRPFAGFSWGRSEFTMPMGRFPVLPPTITLPASNIPFQASDYWKWAVDADFSSRPVMAPAGAALWAAAEGLCTEFVASTVTTATSAASQARVPAMVWDKTAHDAIMQCVDAFGGDVYVDRDGIAVIEDHVDRYGPALTDGDDGTVISISRSDNWPDIKNSVVVSTTNDDHKFEPFELTITDPDHPAHVSRIGLKRFAYSSPLLTERWQAMQVAYGLLPKKSALARYWSVKALPDPSREAGDVIPVNLRDWDPFQARIMSVTHDLMGGDMEMTLGSI